MARQLEGRAFSRLQQFAALPEDLQEETKALELHLTTRQAEVFGAHHANIIRTVRSIRAKPLLDIIVVWIKSKDTPPSDASNQVEVGAEQSAPIELTPTPTVEPVPTDSTLTTDAAATPTTEAAAAPTEADINRLARAKELLGALVLHGFITPNKEAERSATTTSTPSLLVFKESELFVPLAPAIVDAADASTTVWQLVDGAVFTGFYKRKAGFLAPLTQGKDAYLVANSTQKTVTLFESDISRTPVAQFDATTTNVAFDKSHFVHGVKIWTETTVEMLNAATQRDRESLVHALVTLGLQYREEPTVAVDKIASIYELEDVDIDGNRVKFDSYKGNVLLVVNVSSQCGLTPTNYPELVALDTKYRHLGLKVLAFPCNQFGGQEPGTHDEIKTFVQQYNVEFPLFAKGDVNGVEARPLFSYLKSKVEGDAYIRWNFTKFLVDRNGVPVKRFGPMELPLSFESEIEALLSAEVSPEVAVETKPEAVETAPEVVESNPEVVESKPEVVESKPEVVESKPEVVTQTTTATVQEVVTETAAAAVVTETVTKTETAIETVAAKVTTLSVDSHPVEEVTETKTTVTVTGQALVDGQYVPGFTKGNEPTP